MSLCEFCETKLVVEHGTDGYTYITCECPGKVDVLVPVDGRGSVPERSPKVQAAFDKLERSVQDLKTHRGEYMIPISLRARVQAINEVNDFDLAWEWHGDDDIPLVRVYEEADDHTLTSGPLNKIDERLTKALNSWGLIDPDSQKEESAPG